MMNKMERRLYYISDIHLELSEVPINFNLDSNYENYLALCGDIGSPFERNYENFLLEQSKKFKKVFIILGNHEYYNARPEFEHRSYSDYNKMDYITEGMFSSLVNIRYRDMKMVEDKVRKICSKTDNLIFLTTNESFKLDDGTLFVGCTLWSEVDENAEKCMNDYRKIFITNNYVQRKINYRDVLQIHGEMKDYLEEIILHSTKSNIENQIKQIIVLTHHAPSFEMTLKNHKAPYYASDCEHLFVPPVKYWISGHTHECKDLQINDIPSLSNCVGYVSEKTNYDINKFVTF